MIKSKHGSIFKYTGLPAKLQDMTTQGELSGYPLHFLQY